MAELVLHIDKLSVALPTGADRPMALHNISLQLHAGQTLCVVGESGSGKSVLATTIMGLLDAELKVAGGSLKLQGESLLDASQARLRSLRARAMGMVFQEPMTALNPVMRCGEQIDELLRTHTRDSASQRRAAVLHMLAQVRLPEPERMWHSYPHQLSDVTTQKDILQLIQTLQQETGSAVLFITHDMGVVADIADQVLVMHRGEAVELGSREQVLHSPQQAYTRDLLAAVPSMTPPPARQIADTPPLLRAVSLGKTYDSAWGQAVSTRALHDASLSLRAGETVGIVGESGSGKSTLARCVLRLVDPSSGDIFWGDDEIATLPEAGLRPLRHRVQVVFQDPNRSLNPRMTVGESLIEGARNFGMSRAEAIALAEQLLLQVQLPVQAMTRYPRQFSGGQRQRIAIARALACRPQVLVADEAVSALDVSVQAQILQLLRQVQQQYGLGLLFITHDLRVAAQLCDSVIVMHQGEIVERGDTAMLYAQPQHAYTQALMASAPGAAA